MIVIGTGSVVVHTKCDGTRLVGEDTGESNPNLSSS
jgi:hypothetical protein